MPAGRPRKLSQENMLNGNTQKISKKDFAKKLADTGLQVYGEVFTVPFIPEDAKHAVELIKSSMPPGVYCTLDGFLITSFAVAYAVQKLAIEQLFDGTPSANFVSRNKQSQVENVTGWYKTFESSTRLMMSLASQLGLDPRTRMAMLNPNQPLDDQDGLLGNVAHN